MFGRTSQIVFNRHCLWRLNPAGACALLRRTKRSWRRVFRTGDLYHVKASVTRRYAESSLFIGASDHVPATQLNGLAAELLLNAAGSSYRIT